MDDIFIINKDKKSEIFQYVYYTIMGSHSDIDVDRNPIASNEQKSLAYKKYNIDNPEDIQYFIKIGTYGKIFNPIGLYTEGKQNKFLSKVGKNEFVFKRVNNKVFGMYLNFLRTKNLAWLHNAERELS
jgi:hypothetical protein